MEGQPAVRYALHFEQLQISVVTSVDGFLLQLSSSVILGSSLACTCVPFKDGLR